MALPSFACGGPSSSLPPSPAGCSGFSEGLTSSFPLLPPLLFEASSSKPPSKASDLFEASSFLLLLPPLLPPPSSSSLKGSWLFSSLASPPSLASPLLPPLLPPRPTSSGSASLGPSCVSPSSPSSASSSSPFSGLSFSFFGWRYLSNAARLIRPHLFYACFVVSRMTTICYDIHHVRRKPALDK